VALRAYGCDVDSVAHPTHAQTAPAPKDVAIMDVMVVCGCESHGLRT
jgi:hypothetical protein